jgi:hypothetical protein
MMQVSRSTKTFRLASGKERDYLTASDGHRGTCRPGSDPSGLRARHRGPGQGGRSGYRIRDRPAKSACFSEVYRWPQPNPVNEVRRVQTSLIPSFVIGPLERAGAALVQVGGEQPLTRCGHIWKAKSTGRGARLRPPGGPSQQVLDGALACLSQVGQPTCRECYWAF